MVINLHAQDEHEAPKPPVEAQSLQPNDDQVQELQNRLREVFVSLQEKRKELDARGSGRELLSSREAPLPKNGKLLECGDNHYLVNGIRMPKWVVAEVQHKGIAIETLSPHLLNKIVIASQDGRVFDDPHAPSGHIEDMLELTHHEALERQGISSVSHAERLSAHRAPAESYIDREANRPAADPNSVVLPS